MLLDIYSQFFQILELSLFTSLYFVFPVHLSEYTEQIKRCTQNRDKRPKLVKYFGKCSTLEVWQGSENASEINTRITAKSSLIFLLDSNNTMMYLSWVLSISFLAEIICLSGKDTYQTSPYCYQKKCPKHKLIYDGSSYDVICYQNAQWVETKTNPESGAYGDISKSNYTVAKKMIKVNLKRHKTHLKTTRVFYSEIT